VIGQYILGPDGRTPIEEFDLTKWGLWYETADRKVQKTAFGEVGVSTVFLGLDHSFGGGRPMLFETMIFGGEHDGYQERYSTWDQAVAGHKAACALASPLPGKAKRQIDVEE